jgi:hypothetical protein
MKKLTLREKKTKPVCDALKERVKKAKEKLPTSGITSLLVFYHPELDTVKKKSLISNVIQMKQTDEDITSKLEDLVKTINNNN